MYAVKCFMCHLLCKTIKKLINTKLWISRIANMFGKSELIAGMGRGGQAH